MDWDAMARPWLMAEDFLEAAHFHVMQGLMARAGLQTGSRVLDVGCGTGPGIVRAAEAVGPAGQVTGVDVAPPLLRRAAEKAPAHASFIEGDAGSVTYPEAGFDAIISHFGTMFFADTQAAFAHLRRTVPTDARFDFVVWAGPQHNPWFRVPREAALSRLPELPAPNAAAPGPMRFADPAPLVDVLSDAGWSADVDTVDLVLEPPGDAEHVAETLTLVTVGMMLRDMEVGESDLGAIREALVDGIRAYESDGAVRVPARVHYIAACAA